MGKTPEKKAEAPKKPSDSDRIDQIVAVLKDNGISLPKGLE